jgi:hypothetical protein
MPTNFHKATLERIKQARPRAQLMTGKERQELRGIAAFLRTLQVRPGQSEGLEPFESPFYLPKGKRDHGKV